MGLIFLKALVYNSKYAKHKSCAGGAAGAHVAVRDTSVEKTLASHAHAASPRPLARKTRTRNETETIFPINIP